MKRFLSILFIIACCTISFTIYAKSNSSFNSENILKLDGKWELTGISPDGSRTIKVVGTVPGQVHPDLISAGIIPDPFWRKQAEQCQWVEDWEWRYKKIFSLPEHFSGKWLMLQFDGLDTYASIYLNGKLLSQTNDMFIPYEFNISKGWLKSGANEIEVRFAPAVKTVAGKPRNKYSAVFDTSASRVYIRRMQCTFGWD